MRHRPHRPKGPNENAPGRIAEASEHGETSRFDAGLFFDPTYEQQGDELLSFPRYLGRVGLSFLMTAVLVGGALSIGLLGYHFIAGLSWIDALLNASMILTGMGPVDPLHTRAAKLFASAYALFSGVVFLTSVGIVLAPVFHRVIHKFHLDDEDGESDSQVPGTSARG